jgi:hypothetical protein
MPNRDRVTALIALVEQGKFTDALEQFYLDDASMQENAGPPRRGLTDLVAHERGLVASFETIAGRQVGPVFIDNDHVVLNWVFDFTRRDGTVAHFDELTLQRWQGDRIAEERFYYDPAQIR